MEPIEIGSRNENLYDCYTLTCVEAVFPPSGKTFEIYRKINWVTLNPHGDVPEHVGVSLGNKEEPRVKKTTSPLKEKSNAGTTNHVLPKFGSFDLTTSDVMEEDVMVNEPGLVFFEDGSYSRGLLDIPVGDVDDSNYYLSPTFKFEQCLVKGSHKRLRIVHTIEFGNGGSDVQIMRVAIYEEEWVSPAHIHDKSLNTDLEFDLAPFSQRKRTHPSELVGPWKVFEVSATPIYGDDNVALESNSSPYVYLCMETLKKRSLPESSGYFREEEVLDMQDVTVLWLPGGVTSYVDVSNDGILTIGVGWYSDEGINLVMERDYGINGKLKEVRGNLRSKGGRVLLNECLNSNNVYEHGSIEVAHVYASEFCTWNVICQKRWKSYITLDWDALLPLKDYVSVFFSRTCIGPNSDLWISLMTSKLSSSTTHWRPPISHAHTSPKYRPQISTSSTVQILINLEKPINQSPL
ncbi:hypothetical protein V6N13_080945 [Hibiscus sabdariffa]